MTFPKKSCPERSGVETVMKCSVIVSRDEGKPATRDFQSIQWTRHTEAVHSQRDMEVDLRRRAEERGWRSETACRRQPEGGDVREH